MLSLLLFVYIAVVYKILAAELSPSLFICRNTLSEVPLYVHPVY